MRYHYQKPDIYLSMYGELYICNHPVYDRCTLFTMLSATAAVTSGECLKCVRMMKS